MVGMKIQADTIKNLEGQLQRSKAQTDSILIDSERQIKALHEKELDLKIQSDTIKNLEAQLQGTKAGTDSILIDSEKQIKAMQETELDNLFYLYENGKLDLDLLQRTLTDNEKIESFAKLMLTKPIRQYEYWSNEPKNDLDIIVYLCGQLQDCSQLKPSINAAFTNEYSETYKALLYVAAQDGRLDILQSLIPLLEDKNPGLKYSGLTPLHAAASFGKVEVVKYLVPLLSDKNPKDLSDETPLHLAAQNGFIRQDRKSYLEIVKHLCSQVEDKNPKNKRGRTPLHTAAQYGRLNTVKYLCSQVQDKNPKDNNGWTPLHFAAFRGYIDAVKYLVAVVDDKHPKDYRGRTPMDVAREKGHTEVINILEKY